MPRGRQYIRRRSVLAGLVAQGLCCVYPRVRANEAPAVVERSPRSITTDQVSRILEALHRVDQPVSAAEAARMLALAREPTDSNVSALEDLLNQRTLLRVQLDARGVGRAVRGAAPPVLVELGWRSFLVRIENPARLRGALVLISPVAIEEGNLHGNIHEPHILGNDEASPVQGVPDLAFDFDADVSQWMGYRFGVPGVLETLEGDLLEYQVLQIYSQSARGRPVRIAVGTEALQYIRRVECKGYAIDFECERASAVALSISDHDGAGALASLLIRDAADRLYPAPAHRLEPDLTYQPQIYRADGESLRLPAGTYKVVASRGPEYLDTQLDVVIAPGGAPSAINVPLERWIDPTHWGWYAGDPHIHPEGQSFSMVSKLGLTPETMRRQVSGEALSVGSILIWTGGYYYEKQFLTGHVYRPIYRLPFPQTQRANNIDWSPQRTPHDEDSLIRYDVEQAAFPSNRHGHPILLRLTSHDPPKGRGIYDWPSWNLPVLRWARAQDAVIGYAHCGNGMTVESTTLPNYDIPAFDGLGANECLVDVTHGLVDFVAGGEFQPAEELNFWYHLLNCGFALPMVGETDFPGISHTRRVGTARTYVKMKSPPKGDAGFSDWVDGLKAGRLYFGDGRSHLVGLEADGLALGRRELQIPRPGVVSVSARIAARLPERPDPGYDDPSADRYVYWHLERARIGSSRTVALEVVVNGEAVERRDIQADGQLRPEVFNVDISRSSWIALRILPSAHTAPIYVSIAGAPIRASRRSARWCLECVDVIWEKLRNHIRESERADAAAAYEHARQVYRQRLAGCERE